MENYRQLYESMFNKNLADDDARDFLYDITQQYPFFSPAQFLLLHKTAKTDADYKQQLMKTAAAFNNSYWLNFLLLQKDREAFIESFSAQETIADAPANQTDFQTVSTEITSGDEIQAISINEEHINSTSLDVTSPETEQHCDDIIPMVEEPAITNNNEITETVIENDIENAGNLRSAEENEASNEADTNEEFSSQTATLTTDDLEAINEEPIEENELQAESVEEPALSPALDDIAQTADNDDDADNFSRNAINTAFVNEGDEESSTIEDTENEAPLTSVDINEESKSEEEPTEEDEADFTTPLKTDLAEAAAILDTKPVENGPVFEPLHTTDYFASVGIKLSDELKPGDRLGSQLRSFTDWLKTMKKLPGHTQTATAQEVTEKLNTNIQQLAEKSNKEDEIITEAMADVLMQQGRIDKAVEVLKKLSLLNPSKNTYFAAKIDKLKEE